MSHLQGYSEKRTSCFSSSQIVLKAFVILKRYHRKIKKGKWSFKVLALKDSLSFWNMNMENKREKSTSKQAMPF